MSILGPLCVLFLTVPMIAGVDVTSLLTIAECPAYVIIFNARNSCFDYGGVPKKAPLGPPGSSTGGLVNNLLAPLGRLCEVNVCGDGETLVGYYCGVGSCNAVGRNCDGGCIPGNATEAAMRFEIKAGVGEVCNVREYFSGAAPGATPCPN